MCSSSKYPCGKCSSCLARKRNEWSIRSQFQSESAAGVFFGLLTYSDSCAHEVVDEETGEVNYSLEFSDVQKCFKRFRKNHGVYNVSYLVAGEYGEKNHRPHWHLLLFVNSVGFENDYQMRSYQKKALGWRASLKYHRLLHRDAFDIALYKINDKFAIHNTLAHEWRLGFTPLSYPRYNNRCVHYATKYIYCKLQNVPAGCSQPVFRVSKGIGKKWLDNCENVHHVMSSVERGNVFVDVPDSRFVLRLYDFPNDPLNGRVSKIVYSDVRKCTMYRRINCFGGNYPLPRYYVKKIYDTIDPLLLKRIKDVNTEFFNYSYYRRIKDWMRMKHYGDDVFFSDVHDEWITYCKEVDNQQFNNLKNKYGRKRKKIES